MPARTMISAQTGDAAGGRAGQRLGGADGAAEPPLYALMRDRICR